jgi:hypothetical protein
VRVSPGGTARRWCRPDYRALQQQVRELQRLLGKKTLENEILREALDLAQPKNAWLRSSSSDRAEPS